MKIFLIFAIGISLIGRLIHMMVYIRSYVVRMEKANELHLWRVQKIKRYIVEGLCCLIILQLIVMGLTLLLINELPQ